MDNLKKSDIDEVKSLKTPPGGVKLAMEVCCHMFGVKPNKDKDGDGKKFDNYFSASKTALLADAKAFLSMMFDYDKVMLFTVCVLSGGRE